MTTRFSMAAGGDACMDADMMVEGDSVGGRFALPLTNRDFSAEHNFNQVGLTTTVLGSSQLLRSNNSSVGVMPA